MGGIEHVARSVSAVLHERLPSQGKTQRENLALLVATMLSERSANLMSLAAALPRPSERIDMRYQWIVRVLANPLIDCEAVMLPFAHEVLGQAQAEAGSGEPGVDLILDQSRASERHQILMLALRWGERALPLAWRVEETEGAIGFGVQKALLDTIAAWLPKGARVRLRGDRFYGTPALIGHCQSLGWDYRLRLKGNLRLWIDGANAGPVERLARDTPYLTGVELTARRVRTNVGFIQDAGHEEPWIVAMSETPGHLTTLDSARRWGIEPMFSDFKTRGFGLEDSQIRSRPVGEAHPGHGAGALLRRVHPTVGCRPPCHARRTQAPGTAAEERPAQHDVVVHPRPAPHRQPASNIAAPPATLECCCN